MGMVSRLQASSNEVLNCDDSEVLVRALVAAEDRRFFVHPGVDTKGLSRAISLLIRKQRIQGASTITQQLVRVLTNDYRFSLQRKLKEMCLACVLDRQISKKDQAVLYLNVAYYGWRMNGVMQVMRKLNLVTPISTFSAASIVSRLRYPEPRDPSVLYLQKLDRRARYVEAHMTR